MARGSGVPAATGRHSPLLSASAQDRQPMLQSDSQQTPSAQWPVRHSESRLQARPFAFVRAPPEPPAPEPPMPEAGLPAPEPPTPEAPAPEPPVPEPPVPEPPAPEPGAPEPPAPAP